MCGVGGGEGGIYFSDSAVNKKKEKKNPTNKKPTQRNRLYKQLLTLHINFVNVIFIYCLSFV